MKKLLAISLAGSSLFLGNYFAKAEDYDAFGIDYSGDPSIGNRIYGVDTSDGSKTLLTTKVFDSNSWSAGTSYVSATTGEIMIRGGGSRYHAYNWKTDTWRDVTDNAGLQAMFEKPASFGIDNSTVQIGSDTNDIDVVEDGLNIDGAAVITKNADGSVQLGADGNDIDVVADGLNIDGAAVITKNADGSIQIGADGNDIDITSEGLTVDGVSLITKKDSGEIHIGKNSLITKEEDGVQKLYAQDENGDAININVTEGTKLLIDGVEVQTGNSTQVTTNKNNISTNTSNISTNTSNISTNTSNISTNTSNISTNTSNIKNLGSGVAGSTALTAALTALPQTSKESKLSCGVGTGAYSSRYAVGFGCASKVNERVDVNAGGSYVFGGSKSYGGGTLDSGVVKAGFVFKLGKLNKPTQISMKEKEEFKKEISDLKENNNQIISQNKNLQLENQSIISQNNALLARLERLEKVALGDLKSKDLAVYPLK